MKTGEKIGLAGVLITLLGLVGGLFGFLYYADFSKSIEFHVKLNYALLTILAITVGFIYFIYFTKENTRRENE